MAKVIDLVDDLKHLVHNRDISARHLLDHVKGDKLHNGIIQQYKDYCNRVDQLKADIISRIKEEDLD